MFEAGERVRLKNDPAVVGVVTDRPPEERAGRTFFQIELPTGRRSLPANQLEHVLAAPDARSEEHTSELQSLMRISYAVFCLKKKNKAIPIHTTRHTTQQH